jgi:hypothetical protein
MSDNKAVMRQALAYVEWQAFGSCRSPGWDKAVPLAHEVSESLRAALAESAESAETVEPVAWLKQWDSVGKAREGMRRVDLTPECETWLANMFPTITPLYAHPPAPPASPQETPPKHD